MSIDLNQAKVIRKNKNYSSVEQAKLFYEKERMHQLAIINFPEEEYPEFFKDWLTRLIVFNNPVQMNVWHDKNIRILQDGEPVPTTWDNMCTFSRKFACAEMFQCVEILKRCTPYEVWLSNSGSSEFNSKSVLEHFNEIAYPEIKLIFTHLMDVLDGIENQVMEPIRKKINADLKIMHQLPFGSDVEFIKAKERRM